VHIPFREKRSGAVSPPNKGASETAQELFECLSPTHRNAFRYTVAPAPPAMTRFQLSYPAFTMAADRTKGFAPTPESIAPPDVTYRQTIPPGLPVHRHPLVRPVALLLTHGINRLAPEPLGVSSSCSSDLSRPYRRCPPGCKAPGVLHFFHLVRSQRSHSSYYSVPTLSFKGSACSELCICPHPARYQTPGYSCSPRPEHVRFPLSSPGCRVLN